MRFKINGSAIQVDFMFFFMLALMSLYNQKITFMVLLLSILHELGHIAVLHFFGGKVKKLHISSFGMALSRNEDFNISINKEIAIAFAGPLVNIIISVVTIKINPQFSSISMLLGVFNLLPVTALDGGKVFLDFMLLIFVENVARKISVIVSIITIVLMFIIGIYAVFLNVQNFSILLIVVYLALFMINKPMN